MPHISRIRCLIAAALIGTFLVSSVVTAGTLTYAIGDRVSLSGTAYTTNTMYLFVTGPGLDPNGVNPGQMKSPVVSGDPSTFVQVEVENDQWSYIWNTAHQGFSLKEGTYTIYAVSQPVAKNALPAVYGTIDISLTQGGEPVTPPNGTITITTSPSGASLYVDSRFAGTSPKSFEAPAGTHTLRIESHGYQTIVDTFEVKTGEAIAVEKILTPEVAVSSATTVFPTTQAMTTLSPVPAGTANPKVPLTAGIGILATVCAAMFWSSRKK